MSKEELFIMHVYMYACLYIDIILFIYYLCCGSLFKTSLYLFLWKTLIEKSQTCVSALFLSVTAQDSLCDPTVGFSTVLQPPSHRDRELQGLIPAPGSSC